MKPGERFTILLPIHRPPDLIPFAVDSVLGQSHEDFELFIVCDGAPEETADWANDAARRDPRIRAFVFEKGARHGEAHRHAALAHATGTFVAHITDDDLWFPHFLAELSRLLKKVDFGNLLQARVRANGRIYAIPGTLADKKLRHRMLHRRTNICGLTETGYRLSAYRQLPEGWAPAPDDIWSDLHMWRKFLRQEGLTFGTRFSVQSVHLAATQRTEMSGETRAEEIAGLAKRLRRPAWRREIAARTMESIYKQAVRRSSEANSPPVP